MKDMMEYKGYFGSVHYDEKDRLFYGRVEFVKALISYEAADAGKFRKAFEEAVDDYLDLCRKKGIKPEKPFKGSFNVRVMPELHRRAALAAERKGVSLNKFVAEALEKVTK
jgi:predicted HicB family RNase H-like nuclease